MNQTTNAAQSDPTVVNEEPSAYVRRVRSQSAYRFLRFYVDLTAAIVMGSGLASVLLGLLPLLRWKPGVRAIVLWGFELPVVASPSLIIAGLAGIVAGIAARQAGLVLIDIADILIDRNRRAWTFGGENAGVGSVR